MIDGNISMANAFTYETQEQNSYWADVYSVFQEMDNNFDKYPLPIHFDPRDEQMAFLKRERRLKEIAERYVRMKYYNLHR